MIAAVGDLLIRSGAKPNDLAVSARPSVVLERAQLS